MNSFEVPEPILNIPFAEPVHHWYIREGEEPQKRKGRRPSIVYPPRDERRDKHVDWSLTDGTLRPSADYSPGYELVLVNLLRERVAAWRKEVAAGGGNVTRTTLQLLQWWRREGRQRPLFFAQIEAAETIIFLKEARPDFLQGINVPCDEPSEEGYSGFMRYAYKMATGSGKTTVMGMLAAWSILNKVHSRGDCPLLRRRAHHLSEYHHSQPACRARSEERRSEHLSDTRSCPAKLEKRPVRWRRLGDELARSRSA